MGADGRWLMPMFGSQDPAEGDIVTDYSGQKWVFIGWSDTPGLAFVGPTTCAAPADIIGGTITPNCALASGHDGDHVHQRHADDADHVGPVLAEGLLDRCAGRAL